MQSLKEVFRVAGGIDVVSTACGVSPRALYKWVSRNSLPRTEYTGETCYAASICNLSSVDMTPEELKKNFSPSRAA